MPGFLYYFPGETSLSIDGIRKAGLGYAFETDRFTASQVLANGPDRGSGLIVADWPGGNDRLVGCYPDRQVWRSSPLTPHPSPLFIGMYRDEPPGPRDLARREQLAGEPVTLADGRQWLVPVVRSWRSDEESTGWVLRLPTVAGVDDQGEWINAGIVSRYQRLYDDTMRWWDAKYAALFAAFHGRPKSEGDDSEEPDEPAETIKAEFSFADLYDVALNLLQANYRLGKIEVAMLGLFDSQRAVDVLDLAVDWPMFADYLKKKGAEAGAASSSTGAGPAV